MTAQPTFSTLGKRRNPQHTPPQQSPGVESCPDCDYLKKERAGMWIDNGAPLHIADEEGRKERCHKHRKQIDEETVKDSKRYFDVIRKAAGMAVLMFALNADAIPLVDAIKKVESYNGKPGDRGRSRSHWQLSNAAWQDVNRIRKAKRLKTYTWQHGTRNEYISRVYATAYVDHLAQRISARLNRPATPREIYVAYNWGITRFERVNFNFNRAPRIVRERAQRVENLANQ